VWATVRPEGAGSPSTDENGGDTVDSSLASLRGILAWDLPTVYCVNGVRSAGKYGDGATARSPL
jgi:hypothetical protein